MKVKFSDRCVEGMACVVTIIVFFVRLFVSSFDCRSVFSSPSRYSVVLVDFGCSDEVIGGQG